MNKVNSMYGQNRHENWMWNEKMAEKNRIDTKQIKAYYSVARIEDKCWMGAVCSFRSFQFILLVLCTGESNIVVVRVRRTRAQWSDRYGQSYYTYACTTHFPYLVRDTRFDGITSFVTCRCLCVYFFVCASMPRDKLNKCMWSSSSTCNVSPLSREWEGERELEMRCVKYLKCMQTTTRKILCAESHGAIMKFSIYIHISHAHLHWQRRVDSEHSILYEACSQINNTQIPVSNAYVEKKKEIKHERIQPSVDVHTRSRIALRECWCANSTHTHNFNQWEWVGMFLYSLWWFSANWFHFHLNVHWKKWNDSHTHTRHARITICNHTHAVACTACAHMRFQW